MTYKAQEFKSRFLILKGKLEYSKGDFFQKFNEFKDGNSGKRGEVIFKIDEDSVEHWQHQWYRGYLVPPIARECFDNDRYKSHIELKKMFLFREVSSYSEIPAKHRDRCIPLFRQNVDRETGEVEDRLCGYLPSTANLTYDEMKEFILNVEKFMSEFIQEGYDNEALAYRNLAFGIGQSGTVNTQI